MKNLTAILSTVVLSVFGCVAYAELLDPELSEKIMVNGEIIAVDTDGIGTDLLIRYRGKVYECTAAVWGPTDKYSQYLATWCIDRRKVKKENDD